MATDGIKWSAYARVLKYDGPTCIELARHLGHAPTAEDLRWMEAHEGLKPDSISEAHGNLLTTAGLARITALITANGGLNAFNNANAVVGVGNSATAAAITDTDLNAATGATNRYVMGADSSNPTSSNGVITCNSTFVAANGNFAWQEWAWAIATGAITPGTGSMASVAATSLVMLNHKVQSLGTKISPAVWTLQATITLS